MFDHCRQLQISLNLKKCIFCVPFGNMLGHIVCREGVLVDPAKVVVILNMPPPTIAKKLWSTFGSHWVLSQVYQKLRKHNCPTGEVVEEI
jgi:hypothetical protein